MKDFAGTYEQRRWEFAANQHARACEALKTAKLPAAIEWYTKRKQEIEAVYPQLAKKENF